MPQFFIELKYFGETVPMVARTVCPMYNGSEVDLQNSVQITLPIIYILRQKIRRNPFGEEYGLILEVNSGITVNLSKNKYIFISKLPVLIQWDGGVIWPYIKWINTFLIVACLKLFYSSYTSGIWQY